MFYCHGFTGSFNHYLHPKWWKVIWRKASNFGKALVAVDGDDHVENPQYRLAAGGCRRCVFRCPARHIRQADLPTMNFVANGTSTDLVMHVP